MSWYSGGAMGHGPEGERRLLFRMRDRVWWLLPRAEMMVVRRGVVWIRGPMTGERAELLRHEMGHLWQQRRWGWTYLWRYIWYFWVDTVFGNGKEHRMEAEARAEAATWVVFYAPEGPKPAVVMTGEAYRKVQREAK